MPMRRKISLPLTACQAVSGSDMAGALWFLKEKDSMKNRSTYDRVDVGNRLRRQRKQQGWSRGYVAEKIGIVEKYYADIERGTCGMSIETMMALAAIYQLSLDEFIYGPQKQSTAENSERLAEQLERLSPQEREYCSQLVLLFLKGLKKPVAVRENK